MDIMQRKLCTERWNGFIVHVSLNRHMLYRNCEKSRHSNTKIQTVVSIHTASYLHSVLRSCLMRTRHFFLPDRELQDSVGVGRSLILQQRCAREKRYFPHSRADLLAAGTHSPQLWRLRLSCGPVAGATHLDLYGSRAELFCGKQGHPLRAAKRLLEHSAKRRLLHVRGEPSLCLTVYMSIYLVCLSLPTMMKIRIGDYCVNYVNTCWPRLPHIRPRVAMLQDLMTLADAFMPSCWYSLCW